MSYTGTLVYVKKSDNIDYTPGQPTTMLLTEDRNIKSEIGWLQSISHEKNVFAYGSCDRACVMQYAANADIFLQSRVLTERGTKIFSPNPNPQARKTLPCKRSDLLFSMWHGVADWYNTRPRKNPAPIDANTFVKYNQHQRLNATVCTPLAMTWQKPNSPRDDKGLDDDVLFYKNYKCGAGIQNVNNREQAHIVGWVSNIASHAAILFYNYFVTKEHRTCPLVIQWWKDNPATDPFQLMIQTYLITKHKSIDRTLSHPTESQVETYSPQMTKRLTVEYSILFGGNPVLKSVTEIILPIVDTPLFRAFVGGTRGPGLHSLAENDIQGVLPTVYATLQTLRWDSPDIHFERVVEYCGSISVDTGEQTNRANFLEQAYNFVGRSWAQFTFHEAVFAHACQICAGELDVKEIIADYRATLSRHAKLEKFPSESTFLKPYPFIGDQVDLTNDMLKKAISSPGFTAIADMLRDGNIQANDVITNFIRVHKGKETHNNRLVGAGSTDDLSEYLGGSIISTHAAFKELLTSVLERFDKIDGSSDDSLVTRGSGWYVLLQTDVNTLITAIDNNPSFSGHKQQIEGLKNLIDVIYELTVNPKAENVVGTAPQYDENNIDCQVYTGDQKIYRINLQIPTPQVAYVSDKPNSFREECALSHDGWRNSKLTVNRNSAVKLFKPLLLNVTLTKAAENLVAPVCAKIVVQNVYVETNHTLQATQILKQKLRQYRPPGDYKGTLYEHLKQNPIKSLKDCLKNGQIEPTIIIGLYQLIADHTVALEDTANYVQQSRFSAVNTNFNMNFMSYMRSSFATYTPKVEVIDDVVINPGESPATDPIAPPTIKFPKVEVEQIFPEHAKHMLRTAIIRYETNLYMQYAKKYHQAYTYTAQGARLMHELFKGNRPRVPAAFGQRADTPHIFVNGDTEYDLTNLPAYLPDKLIVRYPSISEVDLYLSTPPSLVSSPDIIQLSSPPDSFNIESLFSTINLI